MSLVKIHDLLGLRAQRISIELAAFRVRRLQEHQRYSTLSQVFRQNCLNASVVKVNRLVL